MQTIGIIDTAVFYAINQLPHGWLSDGFFGMLSGLGDSGFIWLMIGIWLIFREEKRDKRFFLPLGIAGGMSWFLSEILIKSIVARLRPSNALDHVISVGFPNGYSFPSSHATLAFAFAVVLSYKEPKLKKFFFILAILIGFSRIYLGYHYPGDVLAGIALGLLIGYLTTLWYRQSKKKKQKGLKKSTRSKKYQKMPPQKHRHRR
ncbi:MAG: phosphatase PAP2 family protein [Microgenomates group bacterium]